jgi:tRNA(adenine34) deaminase
VHQVDSDIQYMRQALACAQESQEEVPVGALLVVKQQIIARACNQTITLCDPTAHAEILILRQAAQLLNNYRLLDATIYVTLEPCPMCVGAMLQARIKRLVFSAYDKRLGALGSVFNLLQNAALNHRFLVCDGLLAQESAEILKQFFLLRRRPK